MKKNKYSGSSFDDFLKEEGIYEEVKTLAQKELASERYKRYPIVIYKDPDSDYGMLVPDLPGCYTFGDTITDVLRQAVEAIECHLGGMLLAILSPNPNTSPSMKTTQNTPMDSGKR